MACSFFYLKALTTVALIHFAYTISYDISYVIYIIWRYPNEDTDYEDSDFEALDTEHFPLPDKGPPPPPYEPPPPQYDN